MSVEQSINETFLLILGMSVMCWSATGIAEIKGTSTPSSISGTVHFEETAGGLKVSAALVGVPPGQHGFHIHEKGDCSAPDGASAGGHFNPTHAEHGAPDNPSELLFSLPNGRQVAVSKEKPYIEIIGYAADLVYPLTGWRDENGYV